MIYIETQKLINGVVNKGGKVYIGKYGLDPLLPANKLTVYDKSETAITGFGLTLNFNSDVIVNGEAKGIYAKESYSIQFIDADGATYPKDFVNIVLPVDAEESGNWVKTLEPVSDNITITNDDEGNYQIDTGGLVDADTSINWVKTLIPQTSNIQVTDDGEGNYTIDASALGGGDVFKTTDNTYDEGTTQNFDAATADTMSVGGVDVTTKNAAQDAATVAAQAAADESIVFSSGLKSNAFYSSDGSQDSTEIENLTGSKKYLIDFKGGFTSGSANTCSFKVDIDLSSGNQPITIRYILDFIRDSQAITFSGVETYSEGASNTLLNQTVMLNDSNDIGSLVFSMEIDANSALNIIDAITVSLVSTGGSVGVPILILSSSPSS